MPCGQYEIVHILSLSKIAEHEEPTVDSNNITVRRQVCFLFFL